MNLLRQYLSETAKIRATGRATGETSYYPALKNLLESVGKTLKPSVQCVMNLKKGVNGLPDGGLFLKEQLKTRNLDESWEGTKPARGVIEAKAHQDSLAKTVKSEQVNGYLETYGLVLVTHFWNFQPILRAENGHSQALEAFQLAEDEKSFWRLVEKSDTQNLDDLNQRFTEYLQRILRLNAPINDPKDLAWFLASYAREARYRLEHAHQNNADGLAGLKRAMEDALGLTFEDAKGEHFFQSTFVQTLFYGIFSAWVFWRQQPHANEQFSWKQAAWTLHVPMIQALFEVVSKPSTLNPLNLTEVLDWTESVLNRVDAATFFEKFNQDDAVQYFYEPFLQAFDPVLRKKFGVWYTPREVVRYMVERVDQALISELNIPLGLADPNVVVLDPCCGTGAFLVEVVHKIARTLESQNGRDALTASDIKKAVLERIFGFEILAAPYVIAHWQLGLLLQRMGVPLKAGHGLENERAAVYLTNALTGWHPPKEKPKQLLMDYPQLKAEKDKAEQVKQHQKIIVILGNPPYDGFAGVAQQEESDLVTPYKKDLQAKWGIRKFNLGELYVRFMGLAERQISEKAQHGIVCYISSYSYLSDSSLVVLRERYLKGFDAIWIDNLNGDSRETGKRTPDGQPDPSVFSTEYNKVGIQLGTAIGLFVKKQHHPKTDSQFAPVHYQTFWGKTKRADLLNSLQRPLEDRYQCANPTPDNRLSLQPHETSTAYLSWPKLTDLCAQEPITGYKENRGFSLIDDDLPRLKTRMQRYFDKKLSWESLKTLEPILTQDAARYDAKHCRETHLKKAHLDETHFLSYVLRPFEAKNCYYSGIRPLWNEPRPALFQHQFKGNGFLVSRPDQVSSPEGIPFYWTTTLQDFDSIRGHAYHFPSLLNLTPKTQDAQTLSLLTHHQHNFSSLAQAWMTSLGLSCDDTTAFLPWHHALAIGYSPAYLAENKDGIRSDWPRIPLPADKSALEHSAQLGQRIAALLDTETALNGDLLWPLLKYFAIPTKTEGGSFSPESGDLEMTANWGHHDTQRKVMPGPGKTRQRAYTPDERKALEAIAKHLGVSLTVVLDVLGHETLDVYLNEGAYWQNIPLNVWQFVIGGYQVIKKWLSYRDIKILGRGLHPEEVRTVQDTARRLSALCLLQPALDENYRRIAANAYPWAKKST